MLAPFPFFERGEEIRYDPIRTDRARVATKSESICGIFDLRSVFICFLACSSLFYYCSSSYCPPVSFFFCFWFHLVSLVMPYGVCRSPSLSLGPDVCQSRGRTAEKFRVDFFRVNLFCDSINWLGFVIGYGAGDLYLPLFPSLSLCCLIASLLFVGVQFYLKDWRFNGKN